jgi:hypothetical protein
MLTYADVCWLQVSAEAADDWHQSVHAQAAAGGVRAEVADVLCDVIDCVAAQVCIYIYIYFRVSNSYI